MKVAHIGPPPGRTGGPAGYLHELAAALADQPQPPAHEVLLPPATERSHPCPARPALPARILRRLRRALGGPRFYRPATHDLERRGGALATLLADSRRNTLAEAAASREQAWREGAEVLFCHDPWNAAALLDERRQRPRPDAGAGAPGGEPAIWLLLHTPMPLGLYVSWCWGVPERSWRKVVELPDVAVAIDEEVAVCSRVDRLLIPCAEAADELVRIDQRFAAPLSAAGYLLTGARGTGSGDTGTDTPDRSALRRRFGLPEGAPIGLYLGNAQPYRGLDRLLAGLEELPEDCPAEGRLAVAGPPADSLRQHPRLNPLGRVSDVSGLLAAVDFVVNVNRFSLFDLSTIEAAEAGKPLLLSANGGNLTFERLGAGCRMLPAGGDALSAAQIGAGLSAMWRLPADELATLAAASRRCYERELTPAHLARSHLELYDRAAAGNDEETPGGSGNIGAVTPALPAPDAPPAHHRHQPMTDPRTPTARPTEPLPERCRLLIVGAGPTGLGAAWQLDRLGRDDWLLCEAEAEAGGLASSVLDEHGFTWDLGGHVQFSHYDYFEELMDELLGVDGWHYHDRSSWVWMRGRFIPYPFQLNLRHLPEEERWLAVRGLVENLKAAAAAPAGDSPAAPPANFGEWIDATFGRGIAEIFLRPYNFKVWAYPPEEMSWRWIGDRVALVDLEKVLDNIFHDKDDVAWGPNNRFRFPRRGGTGVIWRTLADRLARRHGERLRFGRRLEGLDTARRIARFADGSEVRYERLISSVALDDLVRLSDLAGELTPALADLRYSSTHIVGVGLTGQPPEALSGKCWMYFPEDDCPFYRVTVFSHYAPANVPDSSRQWSLMAEVAESPVKAVDRERVAAQTIEGMLATGLVPERGQVHHTWHRRLEHGYPTPSLDRDRALDRLLPAFEQRGVLSRGRFGAWKYEVSNQDHSFAQGVEAVEKLLAGGEEETLHHPEVVNARRPTRRTPSRTPPMAERRPAVAGSTTEDR